MMNKKRKLLVIAVIGVIILLAILCWIYAQTFHNRSSSQEQKQITGSGSVVFDQPNIYLFNTYRQIVNQYPDNVKIHYPYLLIVIPENYKQTTNVYDLEKHTKVKEYNKILLDYFNKNILYTDGKTAFYNGKNLEVPCDQGFIKDASMILCITAKDKDPLDNKLISINPQTLEKQDIYSSNLLLGTLSVIHGDLYVAEVDTASQETFISVNGKQTQTPSLVNIVYPMGNGIYYASFKNNYIKKDASYTKLSIENREVQIKLVGTGRIVFSNE